MRRTILAVTIAAFCTVMTADSTCAEPSWLKRALTVPSGVQERIAEEIGRLQANKPEITAGFSVNGTTVVGSASGGELNNLSIRDSEGRTAALEAAPGESLQYNIQVPPEVLQKLRNWQAELAHRMHVANIRPSGPLGPTPPEVPDPRQGLK